MKAKKILLITHGNPKANGAAELFLRSLCSGYPTGQLSRFDLIDHPESSWSGRTWLGHSSSAHAVRFSAIPLLSIMCQWEFVWSGLQKSIEKITRIVAAERVEQLWVVLNSGYTIYLANALRQYVRLPMIVTIWDAPEYFVMNQRMDPFTGAHMMRAFRAVFQAAASCAVASEGMRRNFLQRFGRDSVVLYSGISSECCRQPRSKEAKKKGDRVTVAFAGSLYSKREWNAFIRAVDFMRTGANRYDIAVEYVGRMPRRSVTKPGFVHETGEVSYETALDLVARADVAYLPYWTDRRHFYFAQTAFPSKLSAYVAAGVPVFAHSPAGASPAEFIRRFPLGINCESLNPAVIASDLEHLIFDPELRQRAFDARQRALEAELSMDAVQTRFSAFLEPAGRITGTSRL